MYEIRAQNSPCSGCLKMSHSKRAKCNRVVDHHGYVTKLWIRYKTLTPVNAASVTNSAPLIHYHHVHVIDNRSATQYWQGRQSCIFQRKTKIQANAPVPGSKYRIRYHKYRCGILSSWCLPCRLRLVATWAALHPRIHNIYPRCIHMRPFHHLHSRHFT